MPSLPYPQATILTRPIDLAKYVRACPSSATTRGAFYQGLVDHAEEQLGRIPDGLYEGVSRQQWIVFKKYPLRDFLQLAANVAGAVYHLLPLAEGLRRLGWTAFPTFRNTMAGRVVLYALGNRVEDVLDTAPRAYQLVLPEADVRVSWPEVRRCRLEMRAVYNFVDTYQYGVLEGTLLAHGFAPSIAVKVLANPCDADFELTWR